MHIPALMPVFRQLAGNLLWVCLPFTLLAQSQDTRFGHVSEADVHMTTYEPYPEAEAVMLLDWGEATVGLNQENHPMTKYRFVQRIKILTEAGQSHGDFVLSYEHGDKKENLFGLKASTYLPLPDGGVEEIKLKSRDIFEEKVNDRITLVKFSMPQAQPGAVLEVTYEVRREALRPLKPWAFQQEIPVVLSEYHVHLPEWFTFVSLVWGPAARQESRTYTETVSVTTSGEMESRRSSSLRVKYTETIYRMENLLPLIEEPYLTNLDDHRSRMELQLSAISWPNQPVERVLTTWDELTKELMASDRFGKVIDSHRAIRTWAEGMDFTGLSASEKAHQVYETIHRHLRWNGNNAFLAEENPRDVLDAGEGDAGDLNLILIGLLREAGLQAHPVLISTRAHGKPIPLYPLVSQFNYVIALVEVDGDWLPLDATDPDMPFGMLPKRALNHQGFLAMPAAPQWVALKPSFIDHRKTRVMMHLDSDGKLWGDYHFECRDYQGLEARKAWRKAEQATEAFTRDFVLSGGLNEATLSEISVVDTSLTMPFAVKAQLEAQQQYVTAAGEFIYLQPMLDEALETNPFQLEARSYPVDFATPLHLDFTANYYVPEGYTVESLPEPVQLVLPNRGAQFTYQVMLNGPFIQLMSKVHVDQTLYEPGEEYAMIKEFFEQVVAKQAEPVVFKKIP